MTKILFASSEVYPLCKTGGLADVSAGLPIALHNLGEDVRVIMPAYPEALSQLPQASLRQHCQGPLEFRLLEASLPGTRVTVWLIDIPRYFQRVGGPYQTADGYDWPDNAERFHAFGLAVSLLARDLCGLQWRPDIVHCNDWQTGLVCAYLRHHHAQAATVYTIHNLAYQGLFPRSTFDRIKLPAEWWDMEGVEFHDSFSFMKAGIIYSDVISTVSPTYAREIQTPTLGNGLDGLLRHHQARLYGVLNGIDDTVWNPATDQHLSQPFNPQSFSGKQHNKSALQKRLKLTVAPQVPLIGMVGRMVEQKGYDLVIEALPALLSQGAQLAVLGSGDKRLEQALSDAARKHPKQVALQLGYDEPLAHQIEAGADLFLMPSRYEPCGLNQMYSLRYGTVPIVHAVGGLADSVVDTTPDTEAHGTATGFHLKQPTAVALIEAVARALAVYREPKRWQALALRGMQQDFSWRHAAGEYQKLYALARRSKNP